MPAQPYRVGLFSRLDSLKSLVGKVLVGKVLVGKVLVGKVQSDRNTPGQLQLQTTFSVQPVGADTTLSWWFAQSVR